MLRNFWNHWVTFAPQILLAFIALVLIATFLPILGPKPSQAACDMRWYADPNSACGQATQQPKENASDVSLTPNFHWDYGGYRSGETGCVQPSGCGSYGAIVYLAKGGYSDSNIIASCNAGTASSPIKDASWSCFNHAPLLPDTAYSWVVTPFFDGTVHAEQSWTSHFRTKKEETPKHKACQNNACVLVEGGGADTCAQNSDCAPQTHKECRNNACTVISGAGSNSCSVDNDCVPQTHRECRNQACVVVSGAGSNACNVDNDCVPQTHNECRNNACVQVSGSGGSTCNSDSQCQPASQQVVCDNLSVSPTSGNKPLTVNATLSGHTNNGGSVTNYRFNFGDGTGDFTQSGASMGHTYNNTGSFMINGTVIDNLGHEAGSVNCQKVVTVSQPQVLGVATPPIIPKSGAETAVLLSLFGTGSLGWVLRKLRP